jgi:diaminopimelate decarboxylase
MKWTFVDPRKLLRQSKGRVKRAVRPVVQALGPAAAGFPPSRWELVPDAAGGLRLEGLSLHELLGRWGSPLHVVHAARLRRNAARFRAVPAGCERGVEVFYSYKTNPIPGVLARLHEEGCGAEVISPHELWLARRLGVPPGRIVYNGPSKSEESIREAIELGIELLNVNHVEELPRVVRAAEQAGRRPRVGLRVSTGEGWTAQFGIPAEGAVAAFRQAMASGRLDVVGLHAHRGGMIRDAGELGRFVDGVLELEATLHRELGLSLEVLNFGGSLCTPTVAGLDARRARLNRTFLTDVVPPDADSALDIERYLALLVGRVEARFRRAGRPRPRILVEPGRAMTGDTQMLLTSVITTKAADGLTFAILDAGINLAEAARNEYHQLLPINRHGRQAAGVYTLVGPICSPGDTLYPAIRLPTLSPGDSLAIMDAGAYFVPFATSFSFPQPAIVVVEGGQASLLRRAERFEDLVSYDE